MKRHLLYGFVFAALSLPLPAQNAPKLADGHPDLNGNWTGLVTGPHLKSDDPLVTNLPSRDGNLVKIGRAHV